MINNNLKFRKFKNWLPVNKLTRLQGTDGQEWTTLVDKAVQGADAPHDLNVFARSQKVRYVRLTNREDMPEGALFSVSGLRLFGRAQGKAPAQVAHATVEWDARDPRHADLDWSPVEGATGYIVRWGLTPDRLSGAYMIYGDTHLSARFFNRDNAYSFTIDAFNESGLTRGTKVWD